MNGDTLHGGAAILSVRDLTKTFRGRDEKVTALAGVSLEVREGELFATTALEVVNTRANLLGATRLLDDIALDRYSFLRDAYLARRQNQVYDGNPPEERFDDVQ